MKLHPTLDPQPEILHGWVIEIRFIKPTQTKRARIKAVMTTGDAERKSVSVMTTLDYADTTNQIKQLVVALIEKHDLNFLRNSVGKMSLAAFRTGWIVSLPV